MGMCGGEGSNSLIFLLISQSFFVSAAEYVCVHSPKAVLECATLIPSNRWNISRFIQTGVCQEAQLQTPH